MTSGVRTASGSVTTLTAPLSRAGIAERTLPALAGERTFVDDLGVLGVGIAGAFSALFHARDALGHGGSAAWGSVAVVASVELVCRLVEQRPVVFGLRPLSRWALALCGTVAGSICFRPTPGRGWLRRSMPAPCSASARALLVRLMPRPSWRTESTTPHGSAAMRCSAASSGSRQ
jgi:hypothetical protein